MPSVLAKGLGRVFFPDDMGQDAIAEAMPQVTKQLEAMRPQFQDRIDNPQNYPVIENEGGSISTHRMAAEVDEAGNWYAFPTIVQMPDGELKEFEDPFEAMRYNKSIGNVVKFDSQEEAMNYAKGAYKTKAFKDFYNQTEGGLTNGSREAATPAVNPRTGPVVAG